jgi:hypothetical protein
VSGADIASLRKVYERMEHPGWVHHVADAATGKLVTTRLSQPLAPLSRAERLSQVRGIPVDATIFGSPIYRLSPRYPYQESPMAFLQFLWPSEVHAEGMGLGEEGYASWSIPDLGANVGEMYAALFDAPEGLCRLTLYLSTFTPPGQVGKILVVANGVASFHLTVPEGWLYNTFDLLFTRSPDAENWVQITFPSGSGLQGAFFYTFTLSRLIFVPPSP